MGGDHASAASGCLFQTVVIGIILMGKTVGRATHEWSGHVRLVRLARFVAKQTVHVDAASVGVSQRVAAESPRSGMISRLCRRF